MAIINEEQSSATNNLKRIKELMDQFAKAILPKQAKTLKESKNAPPPNAWEFTPESVVKHLYSILNEENISDENKIESFINFISYKPNATWIDNQINDNTKIEDTYAVKKIISDMKAINYPAESQEISDKQRRDHVIQHLKTKEFTSNEPDPYYDYDAYHMKSKNDSKNDTSTNKKSWWERILSFFAQLSVKPKKELEVGTSTSSDILSKLNDESVISGYGSENYEAPHTQSTKNKQVKTTSTVQCESGKDNIVQDDHSHADKNKVSKRSLSKEGLRTVFNIESEEEIKAGRGNTSRDFDNKN